MALTDNLLEYWTLDSTRNGSLGAINMSITGADAGYTAAVVSNGLVFPGTSGRFSTYTYNSAIPAGSVAFWYKSTGDGSGTAHRVIGKTQVSVTDVFGVYFRNRGRQPYLAIFDTEIVNETTDTLARDTWYHHAVTWDGTTARWYINATETYTVSTDKTVQANSSASWTIGGWSGNSTQQPAGVFDEYGCWLRAITSIEVGQLYNGGAGLAYPLTVAGPTSRLLMMGVG